MMTSRMPVKSSGSAANRTSGIAVAAAPSAPLQPAQSRDGKSPGAKPAAQRAGIQSLDQGLDVMRILAQGGSIKLKDIAARAGMSASKAHRYLASLTRAGWAVQSETAYRLGPEAISMAAGLPRRRVGDEPGDAVAR